MTSLDLLARELAKDGYMVVLKFFLNPSVVGGECCCELHNAKLGFYPTAFASTAVEAVEAAAAHPAIERDANEQACMEALR